MASALNPIQFPDAWDAIYIGNQRSPGVIAIDGIQGFRRGTEWDVKKGKGARGASLTLVQRPPARGSIKFLLWLAQHWPEWDAFRSLLKYDSTKEIAQAVDIYHPALAGVDVDAVVVEYIHPIVHHGKKLYSLTLELIEFFPPPAVDATSTPTTATSTTDPNIPGTPTDLEGTTNDVLISSLGAQADPGPFR